MNNLSTEILYIVVWAVVGSILGFFSFTYNPHKDIYVNFQKCLLSISVGILIALPLFYYFQECKNLSKEFSIVIAGLGAFGLADVCIKTWPKVTTKIIDGLLDKFLPRSK